MEEMGNTHCHGRITEVQEVWNLPNYQVHRLLLRVQLFLPAAFGL